jgi:hypothetical protein
MRTNCCCENTAGKTTVEVNRGRPFVRRCHDIAGWMLPAGGLILLPKCPACLAAYVAIVTGVGISVSAAAYLRMLLLAICIASIGYFAAMRGRRMAALISAKRRDGKAVGHLRPVAPPNSL